MLLEVLGNPNLQDKEPSRAWPQLSKDTLSLEVKWWVALDHPHLEVLWPFVLSSVLEQPLEVHIRCHVLPLGDLTEDICLTILQTDLYVLLVAHDH